MVDTVGLNADAAGKKPRASGRRRRGLRWLLMLSISGLAALAMAAAVPILSTFAEYAAYNLRAEVMPGVQVGSIPLGGLTTEQAASQIDQIWNQAYRLSMQVEGHPELEALVPPAQFGLQVNAKQSAGNAYAIGRWRGNLADLAQGLAAGQEQWILSPWVEFDPAVARRALEDLAPGLHQPAVDASLALAGDQLLTSPSQMGEALDIEASLSLLAADPLGAMLTRRSVVLKMVPVSPMVADVSGPAAQAEKLLSASVALLGYDPVSDERFRWGIGRPLLAEWMIIERVGVEYRLRLDQDALAAFLTGLDSELGESRWIEVDRMRDELLAALEQPVDNATLGPYRIFYAPTTYVVSGSDSLYGLSARYQIPTWKFKEYNPEISNWRLSSGQRVTIPPKDVMFSLPVVMNKRVVISLREQHMWLYEDGELIRDYVVSTGQEGMETLPGLFQVVSHYENAYGSTWDLWMPHFLGIYQAPQGLENGIHGLPLLSSGVRLWGGVLGRPASFGCVVLGLKEAEHLFYWAEDGVVVDIRR